MGDGRVQRFSVVNDRITPPHPNTLTEKSAENFTQNEYSLSSASNRKLTIINAQLHAPFPPATNLPKSVDLRPKFTEWGLTLVGQHRRNSCSVHTFTRAMEFALSRQLNRGVRLSDEFLNWASNQIVGNVGPNADDRGHHFHTLWKSYMKYGVCRQDLMPFKTVFDPNLAPSPEALRDARKNQTYNFTWHHLTKSSISNKQAVAQVKKILAMGLPAMAGSSHSVLIVGYVDDKDWPGGGYFIIADSGWNGGYGGFIAHDTGSQLHSAIAYSRVPNDYGLAWIEISPTTGMRQNWIQMIKDDPKWAWENIPAWFREDQKVEATHSNVMKRHWDKAISPFRLHALDLSLVGFWNIGAPEHAISSTGIGASLGLSWSPLRFGTEHFSSLGIYAGGVIAGSAVEDINPQGTIRERRQFTYTALKLGILGETMISDNFFLGAMPYVSETHVNVDEAHWRTEQGQNYESMGSKSIYSGSERAWGIELSLRYFKLRETRSLNLGLGYERIGSLRDGGNMVRVSIGPHLSF